MAKQSIGVGSTANDGTGDALRNAFIKVNSNTDELYTALGNGTALDTIAKVTGTPVATQIGVWNSDDTLEGVTGLVWSGTQLNVPGPIASNNSPDFVIMSTNGSGRATIATNGELLLSPGSTDPVIMATTNNPHMQFQYSSGGFTNGTLHHDDTDFIIGTDDYGAGNTRVKLDPSGPTVWMDTGKSLGIGTNTPAATLDVAGTGAMKAPVGTTAQRPGTPAQGMIRYNTTTSKFEGYTGSAWVDFH